MKHHLASAAVIALSLGVAASPARAEGAGTFDAWGHTFDRTPTLAGGAAPVVPNAVDAQTTGSIRGAGRPFRPLSVPRVTRQH